MQNTKSFIQYSNICFSINIRVDINGNVTQKSRLDYFNDISKNRSTKYYQNNKEEAKLYYQDNKEKNKEKNKKRNKKYYKKNKKRIKETVQKWRETKKGKIARVIEQAKRKEFGFKPLNNWFKDSHFHHTHINNDHDSGIFIPKELHKSIWHSNKNQESMDKINKLAFEWLNEKNK